METILINSNRSFGNFSEYQLRGSQNRCFALPNFSYGKTTLNANIHSRKNKFKKMLVRKEKL